MISKFEQDVINRANEKLANMVTIGAGNPQNPFSDGQGRTTVSARSPMSPFSDQEGLATVSASRPFSPFKY